MRTLLALVLLLPVAGCDALSDSVDEAACQASGYADEGSVRATIDGDSFSGTCVRVQVEQGALTIVGADNVVSRDQQEFITLTLPSTAVGTYELGLDAALATYTARTEDSDDQADEVFAAVNGTITLDAYTDSSAEGTFTFTGRALDDDEVTVTRGSFEVTF